MKLQVASLGSDPEFFLRNSDHQPVMAFDYIDGTKEEPTPVFSGKILADNVMLELNPLAAFDKGEFVFNSFALLEEARVDLFELAGLTVQVVPEMEFPGIIALSPRAMEFGCDPDFDFWHGMKLKTPGNDASLWRYAGGHIHIGLNQEFLHAPKMERISMMAVLDAAIGARSVWMESMLGVMTNRRTMYGQAGSIRITKYGDTHGIEYRTPSNYWMSDEWEAQYIADVLFNFPKYQELAMSLYTQPDIVELKKAIDTADADICRDFQDPFIDCYLSR